MQDVAAAAQGLALAGDSERARQLLELSLQLNPRQHTVRWVRLRLRDLR